MKLILSYTGRNDEDQPITPVLPVECDSIEQARNEFAAACLDAFIEGKRQFCALGHSFSTPNFFRRIDERQVGVLRMRHPDRKWEVHLDGYGQMHHEVRPRIEALDVWFERVRAQAAQNLADFLPRVV